MKCIKQRIIAILVCLQMLSPNYITAANKDDLFLRVKETALGINEYSPEYDRTSL